MPARRARTGRGWDASPPRPRRAHATTDGSSDRQASRTGSDAAAAHAEPSDPYEMAREICLRQLSFRPRTRAELATALRKRGVADEVATTVLDRYDEVGLIDDAAFSRAWVSSRHHGRGLARRALASELRQRGVDAEVASVALEGLDPDTEAATARSLVERRLRSMGSAPPEMVFRRLVSMLARKGYPAGVAIGAVKDALAERAATSELAAQLDVDELASAELVDLAAVDPDATALD
jgi:regulatory protein